MPRNREEEKLVVAFPKLFEAQVLELSEYEQVVVLAALEHILAREGINLARTPWLKSLGGGLWEFRIGPNSKAIFSRSGLIDLNAFSNFRIVVRIFCIFKNDKIVLLSCYDKLRKGPGRRQNQAIEAARKMKLKFLERR